MTINRFFRLALKMYARKGGHLLRLIGAVDVNALCRDDVQHYINRRLDEGAHRETVRKELCTLRRALEEAKERGLFLGDSRVPIPKFHVRYRPRECYLTEPQLGELLLTLRPHRRLWVLIAAYQGARASEVERIEWETDIDLVHRRIRLPGTKTAKARRWLPMAAPVLTALEAETRRSGSVVAPWPNVRHDLAHGRALLRALKRQSLRRCRSAASRAFGIRGIG